MSETATSLPPGMRPDAAKRRIAAFTKRFGEAHLHLAYHAAFPLALTPDLLYRLRANFQRDICGQPLNIPWIAVADLLLSSLCEEVGYEHYEMKVAVRHELLNQLKANERFGPQRITELSNFLIKYVRQQLDSHDPDVRDFAHAQYWTALVATRPEEAAHSIALTLSKLDAHDRAEFARMRSLIEMFGEPSQEFATLLSYVKSMEQYARGDEEGARIGLERVAGQRHAVGVRGVELPVPRDLRPITEQESYEVISNPCPNCGVETRPESKFCSNCGNRLSPVSPFEEIESMDDVKVLPKDDQEQKEPVLSESIMPANAGERIGQQVGSYRLLQKLSRDNFNEIYLGQDIHSGRYVAVKMRRMGLETEAEFLLKESRILARLDHPHIIRIFDFGEQNGVVYLIMEYASKGSLYALHARGEKLPLETVVRYVKQIASALQYVHDNGIIHCNVKPTNMLLKNDDSLLLSDFGLAIAVPTSDASPETEVFGTPAYMAPEQIQGKPRFASDQYALAIVVYEWLTGTLPFQSSSPMDVLIQRVNVLPDRTMAQKLIKDGMDIFMRYANVLPSPPETINPAIPANVSSVVLKALARSSGDRYGSVQAFADTLERAWVESSTQKVITTPSSSAQPIREDDKSRLAPGTILVGRYRLEKMVASGGIAAVYRASDTFSADEVNAVKVLLIDELQSDEERQQAIVRFRREARSMRQLNHPGIPRLYNFGQDGNKCYLTMEWIEGRALTEVLEKEGNVIGADGARVASEAHARNWGQQLCNVLSYLHQQSPPVVFRALKPSNVMVTDRDEIKLVDFDIARTFQAQGGTVSMTIGYSAPEQVQGKPEPRSDIYALGATLHRILTHYDAVNNYPNIFSFPSIRTLRPDVSPEFEQVVMKALEPELEKRWASAEEMERAILGLPQLVSREKQAVPLRHARVLVEIDEKIIGEYVLNKPVVTVGRVSSNDVPVPHHRVSRLHAKILWRNGAWILENEDWKDADSSHAMIHKGTYVESLVLRDGYRIYFTPKVVLEYREL